MNGEQIFKPKFPSGKAMGQVKVIKMLDSGQGVGGECGWPPTRYESFKGTCVPQTPGIKWAPQAG